MPPIFHQSSTEVDGMSLLIWKTAEKVAETFGLTLEETVNATRKNTLELFKSVNKPHLDTFFSNEVKIYFVDIVYMSSKNYRFVH